MRCPVIFRMLDTILEQIKNALDSNQTIQIDASPQRFGFIRDGLNYKQGLHGFREWWVLENCMRTLLYADCCDFHYTNFDTLHVTPKYEERERGQATVTVFSECIL